MPVNTTHIKQQLFFVLLTLQVCIHAHAQKDIPGFGKIDKADLLMKDCDFDKGAEAMILLDWGNFYYDRGVPGITFLNTIFEKRERIKILKNDGLNYANVAIPYYDNNAEERIVKIDALTYNLDESGNVKVTEVNKSSIYSKRINRYYSKMIIAFPEAKVGSVIEYKFTMERQTDHNLKDWQFQERIPTRYSEYQINVPAFYRFSVRPTVVDSIEVKESVKDGLISTNEGILTAKVLKKNFIMRNLIGLRDEPFMGSARDYQQRLEFQLSQIDYGDNRIADLRKTWDDVVKLLNEDEDFGKQLEWAPTSAEAVIEQAKRLPDTVSRLNYIFNYVRRNMSWNGDDDIYSYNGINSAFNKKTGSSADINLMLVCMLNKADVLASPILLSTRDNGLVNKFYPFINQFNTVMAHVKVGNSYFILDATDKTSSYKLLPERVVNTQGLIIHTASGEWVELFDLKHKYKVMTAVHGEIDANGIMKGDCLVNCNDYARKQRCDSWLKNKDAFKEEYFTQPGVALKIDELSVNNVEADSLPLEQKVKFSAALNSSGEYKYFALNLFSDLDKNPFVADERISDVDFGFLQDYTIFGNYTIPQDYTYDVLPENISMIMPDTSIIFTRTLQADENLLNVRMSVEFKHTFYPAAYYPEFREFYKKLFAKLNEQVVIKKKPAQ
ncbi:DUF3857 domain-containing protein [Ferruginibacter sp.]